MSIHLVWSMRRLVHSICDRLQNKFDAVIVIEGKRGLGKSTLGFRIMMMVKREMRNRGVSGYKFVPKYDLLYSKKEVMQFFHKWQHSGMADEMINVTFNRDFYNEQQKTIIKMINMNRDHNNLFISCVPQFKNLDSQMKNLCAMKITVVRRGVALIHMPNKTVYSADIWDERVNEKIERGWLLGGIRNPRYARLTTFRGYVKFPKLTDKQEEIYQTIKDEKRNVLAQEQGLEEMDHLDPFNFIYRSLLQGKIKNTAMLDGMIMANNLNQRTVKENIRKRLKEDEIEKNITDFYSERPKSTKEKIKKEKKLSEDDYLIAKALGEIK